MKLLLNYLIISLIVLILISCRESNQLITPPNPNDTTTVDYSDSTYRQVTEGIYVKLDSIIDVYSLEDTIEGKLYLFNESNLTGIRIFNTAYPPHGTFEVTDEQSNSIYGDYQIVGWSVFNEILSIGDTLLETVMWRQTQSSLSFAYDGLKAYSGKYKISCFFWGNALLFDVPLIKWITISEDGDPITSIAHRHYENIDSFKISFIVRNRISVDHTFRMNQQNPLEIHYISSITPEDTVLSHFIHNIPNVLDLSAKSDKIFYTYTISKSDTLLANLNGSHKIIFKLNTEEREIISFVTIYL